MNMLNKTPGVPQSLVFSCNSPGSSFKRDGGFKALSNGERFTINGSIEHKVVVIGGEDTAFKRPAGLSDAETEKFKDALRTLEGAAEIIMRLQNRLTDSEDGRTTLGIYLLTRHLDSLSPEFAQQLRGYLFAIQKEGDCFDKTRGSVFIPPCSRERFEVELNSLPESARKVFIRKDWEAWLDHLYNPIPKVTEGFFLFNSKGDWERFEASLGAEYALLKNKVQMLFTLALDEPLPADRLAEYDAASKKLLGMQKKALEAALKEDKEASGMCIRVRISVDDAGKISLSSTHYTEEFRPSLDALAATLRQTRDLIPEWATELRGVLEAQARQFGEKSNDPNWGKTVAEWVTAKEAANSIGCLATCEEKVSHVGRKSTFHIIVYQPEEVPPELQGIWDIMQAQARKGKGEAGLEKTELFFLRVLMMANHLTFSGEKLPDPAGQSLYKSMTFSNTGGDLFAKANAEALSQATGLPVEETRLLGKAVLLTNALHEYGHTLGEQVEFLGAYAGPADETQAQASSMYLPVRFVPEELLPEMLPKLLAYDACSRPVRWARRGVLEMHARADLVLFDEYLRVGALEIAERDGKHFVRVRDADKLVETAFKMAQKLRLWEKGIPSAYHFAFMEELKPGDSEQDARISQAAVKAMASQKEAYQKELRAEVLAEVSEFFSDKRMEAIGAELKRVTDCVSAPIGMSAVFPGGDPAIAALVA
ncbi:Uncharacterised protein [Candidatus Burarchaeum australiense]|nr:Uncharacterised protein [Candidatus Burarchaeum australiense]